MRDLHRLAFLPLVLVSSASYGAPPRDALSGARSRVFGKFRTGVRHASALHAKGLRDLALDLKAKRTSAADGFLFHAAALTHLSDEADRLADEAAAAFLADAAEAMSARSAVALRGAVPGDGGSLDQFATAVRRELERTRAVAEGQVRTIRRALLRAEGGSSQMRASLPPWTFDLPGAPQADGTVTATGEEPARLRAITAIHLIDGRLLFAAAGTAAPALDGQFEFWLRTAAVVDTAGPTLAEGGVPVEDGGTWGISVELGDPFDGGVPLAGNRVVQFATEPVDMGISGRQPTRFVLAGLFALP